ncbi:MAG TPA: enolase C-terminal domain-like protein [Solirubrobacteraceae bacterium]|nr:enolase C-terminal domain-like protein [Solirubrobacteraceae bacterium]
MRRRPLSATITALETSDVRFPTSAELDGSDAVNVDPDYSAAYAILRTDAPDGLEGHGFAFTTGRGTEVQVAAVDALAPLVVGLDLEEALADTAAFSRRLTGDSQLRWLGPEKGVVHMAAAAVLNALWDLYAKREGVPLWQLLARMSPEQIVALVDFRYLTDALTPAEALALLREREPGRAERERALLADGLPAYTTSPGWLGYDDDKLRALVAEALDEGFTHIKLKVGADTEDDARRCAIARDALGDAPRLSVDANQAWDVSEAIAAMERLAPFAINWIEEPTSPDDVLGHAAIARAVEPIAVATGEHAQNRVIFKQLLQAQAIGVCQIDACRLAGVNEVVAVLLLAAKFGVTVCPHAGGVGLCELVQHLAAFDLVAVGGEREDRVVEYVDHLHEHFVDPCVVERGRYRAPRLPGYSSEMRPESLERHAFPAGAVWR